MSDFIKFEENRMEADVHRAEEEAVARIRQLEEENELNTSASSNGAVINELTSGVELLHYMEHSMEHRDSGEEEILQREDLVISAQGNAWQIAGGKLSAIALAEESVQAIHS